MDEQERLDMLNNPDRFKEQVLSHIFEGNEPLLGEDLVKVDELASTISQELAQLKADGLAMKDKHRTEEVENKIAQIKKDSEYKRALMLYNTIRTTITSNRIRP
jgi:hypothetical protein